MVRSRSSSTKKDCSFWLHADTVVRSATHTRIFKLPWLKDEYLSILVRHHQMATLTCRCKRHSLLIANPVRLGDDKEESRNKIKQRGWAVCTKRTSSSAQLHRADECDLPPQLPAGATLVRSSIYSDPIISIISIISYEPEI